VCRGGRVMGGELPSAALAAAVPVGPRVAAGRQRRHRPTVAHPAARRDVRLRGRNVHRGRSPDRRCGRGLDAGQQEHVVADWPAGLELAAGGAVW